MSLSEDLAWRGLIKDKTFSDVKWLDKPKKFYLGIDASSDSLTIGNLAVIMLARRLLDAGWGAVLLAGGATSLVGDPGGKEEERELKSHEEIARNIDGVKAQVERLFAGKKHQLVNNLEWLDGLKYLDFLRDIGKHYSVTELIQREFVDARIGEGGSGISYAEFSYSLLQGYDFWWLFKNMDVQMQIGASDQWGNMLSGVALIRKKEDTQIHALSMPLIINKNTGRKFGKSEDGAIWLDANRTTIFKFYQFWYNTSDEEVEDHLKVFTLINKAEIESLVAKHKNSPAHRLAQTRLAYEVTALVHGGEQAMKQQRISEVLTDKRNLHELDQSEISILRGEIPYNKLQPGASLIETLVETGLASSNSDARRLIDSKAVYLEGRSFTKAHLESGDLPNGRAMLRRGKTFKDSALIELV